MKEITIKEERHTWYTFEYKEKEYILTCAEWTGGRMIVHGLGKDGHVLAMEMQYGVCFTGSIDSIDDWLNRTT